MKVKTSIKQSAFQIHAGCVAGATGKVRKKLRVTYKGKRKYYSTAYDVSNAEWEIINSSEDN